MLEELRRHHRAYGVRPQVIGAGGAAAITVEAGERIATAFAEWTTEDIARFRHDHSLPPGTVLATAARLGNNDPMQSRSVQVPVERLGRWISGFADRHGGNSRSISDGVLHLSGADGATADIRPPYAAVFTQHGALSDVDVDHYVATIAEIPRTAVIAVRRGGFLAAVVEGSTLVAGDAGKRHVQGRTAAGGWSQQRFARRRDKQVHELSQAAADYAARVILSNLPVAFLATGGDRPLIDDVLTDPRLRSMNDLPRGPHLALSDIRKATLRELPTLLATCRIDLVDP